MVRKQIHTAKSPSLTLCVELGIIEDTFPHSKSCSAETITTCSCPQRTKTSPRPEMISIRPRSSRIRNRNHNGPLQTPETYSRRCEEVPNPKKHHRCQIVVRTDQPVGVSICTSRSATSSSRKKRSNWNLTMTRSSQPPRTKLSN